MRSYLSLPVCVFCPFDSILLTTFLRLKLPPTGNPHSVIHTTTVTTQISSIIQILFLSFTFVKNLFYFNHFDQLLRNTMFAGINYT